MTAQRQLAGRHRELRLVVDVLTGASGVSALVVAGEAGIGKSRLVAAATDAAGAQQRTVLTGWCLSLSEDLPFLPMVDVLRALAERDEGRLLESVLAGCPAYVRHEIGRLLPEITDPEEDAAAAEDGGGWRRQRLFGAVQAVLVALGEATPAALVIEDVHWADPATRDLLEYLLIPSHWTGVPMVLVSRGEESDPSWLQDLLRHGHLHWLAVQPLTRAETAEQIELLGGTASPEMVGDIFTRSQGNPFFTEQLVAAGDRPGALPATLHALLLARLGQVTDTGTDVVTALAIARRPLDEAAFCALTGRPAGEIVQAVRDLTARRLLQRSDGGEWQLGHVLLAEAVCSELTAMEQGDWHLRVAKHLASLNDPSLASEVAEHFAAVGVPVEELRWRARAAMRADSVYAPAQAAQQWRRVIALWDAVDRPEALIGIDLAEVYFHTANALENAGDGQTAAVVIGEAMARLLDGADDATRMRLHYLSGYWWSIDSPWKAADLLEKAIEIGARLPPTREYVLALHQLAVVRTDQSGNYALQTELISRALHAAQRAGIRPEQKRLTAALAWLAMVRDAESDAFAGMKRALDFVLEPADPAVEVRAAVYLTDILLKYGDLPRVVDLGRAALQQAGRHGYPRAYISLVLLSNVVEALREQGRITEAFREIDPATREPVGRDSVLAHAELADLDCKAGRLDQAASFWDESDAITRAVPGLNNAREFTLLRAELWLWLGRAAEALADAGVVLQPVSATEESQMSGGLFVLALRACADLAQQGRARGDDTMVSSALQSAVRLAVLRDQCPRDPFGGERVPATKPGDVASWNAEWSRLHGDDDPALWDVAAQAWTDLGRPHRAGYALWRQAEALLTSPRGRAAAGPVLRSAAESARTHVPLSQAIAELARRARIDLAEPSVEPAPAQPVVTRFGLTDRELAVLALLGQGRTNAEIGAALFISPKTASVHVTNILRKLRASSRVQAAAIAARAGLLPASEARDQ